MHNVEKPKPGPHADGVVGSVKSPTIESLVKQIHELSIKQSTTEVAKASPSPQNANFFLNPPKREINSPTGKKREER